MPSEQLARYIDENCIVYTKCVYDQNLLDESQKIFEEYVKDGKLKGDFFDDKWIGFSGLKEFGIYFTFEPLQYELSFRKVVNTSYNEMKCIIRCFAIYCLGMYIFPTIANVRIATVLKVLTRYGTESLKLKDEERYALDEFLLFAQVDNKTRNLVLEGIHFEKQPQYGQRTLKGIVNYVTISEKIREMYYEQNLSEEDYIKWFPVYFWTQISFNIPLRPTEIIVTPFECVSLDEKGYVLVLRRSRLKWGLRTVYYDIERDYKIERYHCLNEDIYKTIKKYQELTRTQKRDCLFQYSQYVINGIFSLASFNSLLKEFMDTYMIGNPEYDFTRYAAGIKEFEYVTAGDSRLIAISNMRTLNIGLDQIRQLAGHTTVTTTSSYVSLILENSSILTYQQMMYNRRNRIRTISNYRTNECDSCAIEDKVKAEKYQYCRDVGHSSDCFGCEKFEPSYKTLQYELEKEKKRLDELMAKMADCINNTKKNKEIDIDQLLVDVRTSITRYNYGVNKRTERLLEKWEKEYNTQRTVC